MIKKLQQMREEATDYEVGTKTWEQVEKINEIIEAINELGSIVDEFTGQSPEFRKGK
jgi:hypothetical protein